MSCSLEQRERYDDALLIVSHPLVADPEGDEAEPLVESDLIFGSGECRRFGDLWLSAVTRSTGGLVYDGFQGFHPGLEDIVLVVRGAVHSVALCRLQPIVEFDEGLVRGLEQSHGGELRDIVGDLNDHVPVGFVDPLDVHTFQGDSGEFLLGWEGEELLEGGDVGRCGCHFWFHKLVRVLRSFIKGVMPRLSHLSFSGLVTLNPFQD